MTTHPSDVDHEQASLLLPWLVNGTLSETERFAVERHAADCAECTSDIEALRLIESAIRNDALTPIVPRPDAANVLSVIGLHSSDNAPRPRGRVARYADYAIAASVFIAITIVALLNIILDSPQPTIFETATSADDDSLMHYVFELRFTPETSIDARQQIFSSINSIDVAPSSENRYTVTVPLAASSIDELEVFVTAVQALPEVESANVIALKLPIGKK